MSFCVLYNVVSENHNVQNSPWGGGGSIASSRSIRNICCNIGERGGIAPEEQFFLLSTIFCYLMLDFYV